MNPLASFELDYNSGLPVWIQVKNRIAYLIGSGEYKAGDQLPTVRSLAVDLDISYNTVNRAYMDLEREGYISTRKGRGTFVAERHAVGAALAADNPVELLADDRHPGPGPSPAGPEKPDAGVGDPRWAGAVPSWARAFACGRRNLCRGDSRCSRYATGAVFGARIGASLSRQERGG